MCIEYIYTCTYYWSWCVFYPDVNMLLVYIFLDPMLRASDVITCILSEKVAQAAGCGLTLTILCVCRL